MLSSDLPKLLCLLYFFAYYIYHILIIFIILRKLCVEFECDILNMIF